jgi:hypothetical protein
MPAVIHIERDAAGLQMAVRARFEEALLLHRMQDKMDTASHSEMARLEAELPEREISPGYYARADYLIDLANTLQLGIPMEPASLTHTDVVGIRTVRSTYAEFEREHPGCPRCGERQDNRHIKMCHACHYKLKADN